MNFRWKQEEAPTKQTLLLVAFPELEGTPFQKWVRMIAAEILGPVRRGLENLLLDTTDAIRLIFGGKR
jgi:hypothetical protein